MKKTETSIWLFLFNYKWVFFFMVIIMMLFKDFVISPTDPVDVGYPSYRSAGQVIVSDERDNGFVISLMTTNQVTEKRLEHISEKSDFVQLFSRIKTDSQKDSLDLVNMDIYLFLDWVLGKEVPSDIFISEIRGIGKDKHIKYLQPNPTDSTFITDVPVSSDQGMVYIDTQDIKNHIQGYSSDVYRYVDCLSSSNTDERFSHISKQTPIQRK